MVKCPECGKIFEIGSFICPRKVSITKKDKIKSLSKHLKKEDNRGKKYLEVSQIIQKEFLDKDITSKAIMQIMGWADHSDGDVTLTFLDSLICRGSLEKTRHKKGRGGHLYKRIEREICPHFENGECKCSINLYKHLEEGEVDGENIN